MSREQFLRSTFQDAARELRLDTPKTVRWVG